MNGGGSVNNSDREFWLLELTHTYFGDSNFDGEFNSSDFVQVFGSAKYETGQPANWSEGDWNGDGFFTSGDFVTAFAGAGYEVGPRDGGIMVVPEPSGLAMIALGVMFVATKRRRR